MVLPAYISSQLPSSDPRSTARSSSPRPSPTPTTSQIVSRLDPQAQISMTGSYSTTSPGGVGVSTSQDTFVNRDAGITHQQADVIQGTGQIYDPAVAELAAKKAAAAAWAAQHGDTIYQGGTQGGVSTGPTTTTTPPPPPTGEPPPPGNPGTEPPPPTGPDAPTGGAGDASALLGFTEDEIAAALRGIEAQFGMTREQLLADQSQAGAQYRLLLAQLERQRAQGVEQATNSAVRRGVYHSGILGEDLAEIEAETLRGRAQAEQQQQAQMQASEFALRNLDAQMAAEGAMTEAQLRRQYAETLLGAGIPFYGGPAGPGIPGATGAAPGGSMPPQPTGGGGGLPPRQYQVDPQTGLGPGGTPTAGGSYLPTVAGDSRMLTVDPATGQAYYAPPTSPWVQNNPYANYPIQGGWYVDPRTGMAVARVADTLASQGA